MRVVLVHGTFSSTSIWTGFASALREKLGSSFQIETFPWSGSNSFLERHEAANELRDLIVSQRERVLLVGHSHGGTVCHLALRDEACQQRVVALLTLGTPFVLPSPVDLRATSTSLATIGSTLCAAILWAAPIAAFSYLTGFEDWLAILLPLQVLHVLGAFPFFWYQTFKRLRPRIRAVLLRMQDRLLGVSRSPECDLPITCVRTIGDEAFGLLETVNVLRQIPTVFLRSEVLVWSFVLCSLAMSAFFLAGAALNATAYFKPVALWGRDDAVFGVAVDLMMAITMRGIPFGGLATLALGVSGVVVALIANRISHSSIGLGVADVLSGTVVRYSVLSAPPNCPNARVLDITVPFGLRHAHLHKNELVEQLVCAWAEERSGRRLGSLDVTLQKIRHSAEDVDWKGYQPDLKLTVPLATLFVLAAVAAYANVLGSETVHSEDKRVHLPEQHISLTLPPGWEQQRSEGLLEPFGRALGMRPTNSAILFRGPLDASSRRRCVCVLSKIRKRVSPRRMVDAISRVEAYGGTQPTVEDFELNGVRAAKTQYPYLGGLTNEVTDVRLVIWEGEKGLITYTFTVPRVKPPLCPEAADDIQASIVFEISGNTY